MTTVNALTTTTVTSGIDPASTAGGFAYLSPDSLLVYCQNQLQGLDGEIKSQMNKQQTALRERQACEQIQQVLEQFGPDGPTSTEDLQKCRDAVDNAIATLGPNDPVAKDLPIFQHDMLSSLPDQNSHAWQAVTDTMKNKIEDIKGGSEIDMLQLQDCVSRRQTAVQLVTNMMSKIDDTALTIAKAV